jgi:hypothetical protein
MTRIFLMKWEMMTGKREINGKISLFSPFPVVIIKMEKNNVDAAINPRQSAQSASSALLFLTT